MADRFVVDPFSGLDEVARNFVQERFCQVTRADTDCLHLSLDANQSGCVAFELLPFGVSKHFPLMQAIFFRESCMFRLAQTVVTESGPVAATEDNQAEKEAIFFAAHENFLILLTKHFGNEAWCKKIAEDRNPIRLYRLSGLMDDNFVPVEEVGGVEEDFSPTLSMAEMSD